MLTLECPQVLLALVLLWQCSYIGGPPKSLYERNLESWFSPLWIELLRHYTTGCCLLQFYIEGKSAAKPGAGDGWRV